MRELREADLQGKKVLVRVDFNVPLNEKHSVTDTTRIQAAIPSIEYIIGKGGSAILMSHLGRPKGSFDEDLSLKHIIPELEKHLKSRVKFAPDCVGKEVSEMTHSLKNGEVLLLENLRFHKEEKDNDLGFARKLAGLGDIYVNDAFGASHRAHASIDMLPQLVRDVYAGMLLQTEVEELSRLMEHPEQPASLIMGGAKVADKIGVIENLLEKINNLIIGGGMAYTFIKAKGGEIGKSKFEADNLDQAKSVLKAAKSAGVQVFLPDDSVVTDDISNDKNHQEVSSYEIADGKMGVDIGPLAREAFNNVIQKSKTIIWNGPMGVFEKEAFSEGTASVGKAVARMTNSGAYTMIGGGDTTAAIKQLDIEPNFSHISTGGGAMLEFLEGKELPGIKAVMQPGESMV